MKFNEKQLYKNYKNITEDCIFDGYCVPVLIRDYSVPKKYKHNLTELQKLYKKQDSKTKVNYNNMLKNRRQTELNILTEKNQEYKTVYEYHSNELNKFIEKYPQYQEIIKDD